MSVNSNTLELEGNNSAGSAMFETLAQVPQVIDGVFGHSHRSDSAQINHHLANHLHAHHPTAATTLMRSGVNKPKRSLKKVNTGAMDVLPTAKLTPKLSVAQADPEKVNRASQIQKHPHVRRFVNDSIDLNKAGADAFSHPAQVAAASANPTTLAVPKSRTAVLLDAAMEAATSHLEKPLKGTRRHRILRKKITRKLLKYTGALAAILLIIGFIAYQNQGNIKMRLAASRAGFNAKLPGWYPSGFAPGKISAHPGKVQVSFLNGGGKNSFKLVENKTNLNSQALLTSFVSKQTNNYQVYKSSSETVYIFGGNAAWVNGGVQYQINSHGNLSTGELLHLAGTT